MGVRRVEVSAPKSLLFDVHNDVHAIDNSNRHLGVLDSYSLLIAH